jgi:hypothetical protein
MPSSENDPYFVCRAVVSEWNLGPAHTRCPVAFGQCLPIDFGGYDPTRDAPGILDANFVASGMVAEAHLVAPPRPWNAGVDEKRRATQTKTEDPLDRSPYIQPADPVYQVQPPRPT